MAIVIVPNTDTFNQWRVKTNTIGSGVGDLSTLINDAVLTYTGLTGQNEGTFTGTPATFTIVNNQGTYEVTVTNGGDGYAVGDTVLITGGQIGGVDGVNDATITVATVDALGVGEVQTATVAGTTTANLVAQVNNLRDDVGDTNTALQTNAAQVRDAINEFEEVLRGAGANNYTLNTDADNLVAAINELETAVRGTNIDYNLDTTSNDLVSAINEFQAELGLVESFDATGTSPIADANHTITYVNIGSTFEAAVNALKDKVDYHSDELGGKMSADYDGPETNHMDALNALYNASSLGTLDNTYVRRSGTLDMTGMFQLHQDGITSNANSMLLKTGAADVTAITISATNQNVGIGGGVGTQKLKVTGGVNATTGFYYNGDDTDTRYIRADVGSAQTLEIDTTVTASINLDPGAGETVTIDGSIVASDSYTFLEWFQDTVGDMFTGNQESGGISGVYNDGTGKITLAIADDGHNHVVSNIDDFDNEVKDRAAAMITGATHSGLATTYDNVNNRLTFNVNEPVLTISGEATGSATMTNLSNTTISVTLDQEVIQDKAAPLLSNGVHTGLSATYDDANNRINLALTADPTIALSGDVSGSVTLTNLGTQTFTINAVVADDSHNHVIGNIDNFTEEVQDIVGAMVAPTNVESGITVTYDDNTGKLNFDVNDPTITLNGDVTGSATMSNLGSMTITTTIVNDSHTHDDRYYTESEADSRFFNVSGDTITGSCTVQGDIYLGSGASSSLQHFWDNNSSTWRTFQYDQSNWYVEDDGGTNRLLVHAGNLGSFTFPSASNANTLDGIDSSQFLRSDANDTATGNLTTSHLYARSNGAYDLGTGTVRYRTMYAGTFNGTATTAQYADLAEKYLADGEYVAGTVIAVGGEAEVTAATDEIAHSVIGVVSENPAFRMNEDLENGTYIALKGRVPVRVQGDVKKGDRLVASSTPGVAEANNAMGMWSFAVALTDKVGDTVEAVIL